MAAHAGPPDIAALLTQIAAALVQAQQPDEPPAPRSMPDRVLLTVEEAADRLGIGRTLMYRLIRRGEIESVLVGRLRRIHVDTVHEYAKSLIAQKSASAAA